MVSGHGFRTFEYISAVSYSSNLHLKTGASFRGISSRWMESFTDRRETAPGPHSHIMPGIDSNEKQIRRSPGHFSGVRSNGRIMKKNAVTRTMDRKLNRYRLPKNAQIRCDPHNKK